MIKFYRKIRQKMLTDPPEHKGSVRDGNKVGRYLIYAIGEIILVVIGILIALYINNLNEIQKQKKILVNIFSIIEEDLNNDIIEINEVLKIKKGLEPIFLKVLDGTMTKEDYKKCPECTTIILGTHNLSIERRGYDLLNKFDFSPDIEVESLALIISQFYSKQLVELYADEVLVRNDLESNINDWKNNYDWYPDFIRGSDSEGFIEYALNHSAYKSKVATYYLYQYRLYVPKYEEFRDEAITILKLLKEKIKE